MQTNRQIILVIIGIFVVISFLFGFGIVKLPRGFYFGEMPEITRTIEMLETNENATVFLVTLKLQSVEGGNALGIKEKVNATPCSEVFDISDGGVEKFGNTIEWFFANPALGLNATDLEEKTISYRVRYEKCLEEEWQEWLI